MCVHVRVRSASRRPGFLIVWVCVVVVQGAHHRHLQAPKGGASKGGERPVEVSHDNVCPWVIVTTQHVTFWSSYQYFGNIGTVVVGVWRME